MVAREEELVEVGAIGETLVRVDAENGAGKTGE